MGISILLLGGPRIVRQALRTLLAREFNMEVVAEAENPAASVPLIRELSPQVVILNLDLPDAHDLETIRQLLHQFPDIRMIALSGHSDRLFVAGILKAGASGYLLKDSAFEELAAAVRAVMANKIYLSPAVSGVISPPCPQSGSPLRGLEDGPEPVPAGSHVDSEVHVPAGGKSAWRVALQTKKRPPFIRLVGAGLVAALIIVGGMLWLSLRGTDPGVSRTSRATPQPPQSITAVPGQRESALRQELGEVLLKLMQAHQKKNISQFAACFSPSFPQINEKIQDTLKIWDYYDFPSMRFTIDAVKPIGPDSLTANITWDLRTRNLKTRKIENSTQTFKARFAKEQGQWRIKSRE